jgi:hypothetical protein
MEESPQKNVINGPKMTVSKEAKPNQEGVDREARVVNLLPFESVY